MYYDLSTAASDWRWRGRRNQRQWTRPSPSAIWRRWSVRWRAGGAWRGERACAWRGDSGLLGRLCQAHEGYHGDITHPNYADVDFLKAEADELMASAVYAHNLGLHCKALAIGHAVTDAGDLRGRRVDSHRLLPWGFETARLLDDREEVRWAPHKLAVLDCNIGNYPAARSAPAPGHGD